MRSEPVRLGFDGDSPELLQQRTFRGVVLASAAPNAYVAPEVRPMLWVHGGTRLDAGQLGRGDAFLGLLSLVLLDERSLEVRARRVLPDFVDEPEPAGPPLDWTGRVAKESFHVELGAFFDLPAADADYVVRAVLGPWSSNPLRIRVRVQS